MSNLQTWATIIGSHLSREPTVSPVLTKWWNWELTLATNFGDHVQMVTKIGGQILATKFGFVPDWWYQAPGPWLNCMISALLVFVEGIHWKPGYFPYKRPGNAELWCIDCCQPHQTVKQRVKSSVIWNAIRLMWRHGWNIILSVRTCLCM